jgi:hypothetical protein
MFEPNRIRHELPGDASSIFRIATVTTPYCAHVRGLNEKFAMARVECVIGLREHAH